MASIPKIAPEGSLHIDVQKRYSTASNVCFQLHVAFTADPGVTILVGRSGAGKSTLLRAIAGLCHPEKGRIAVGGRILFDSEKKIRVEPAKRRIAFVFQDLALFPHLAVHENVSYGLRTLDRAEREHRVAEVLESFQITKLRYRMPREISGGEQQRVALARSLVTEPSVLLLDEPLSSLDAHTKGSIIDDLRAWNDTHRIPMLYVTHNHEEVLALGEHAISLEQGKLAGQGVPMNVVTRPHRQSMAQIVGFENLFDATVESIQEERETMICRLPGGSLDLQLPLTKTSSGSPIHLGIKADEILLASSRPTLLNASNVVPGKVKQMDFLASRVELRIDSGPEFRVHLPARSEESLNVRPGDDIWMIIQPQSCHVIHSARLRATRRLLVFVCSHNTSRSPMAAAICNAEIAQRLKVAAGELPSLKLHAVSAGLNATPGDPMARAAQFALRQIKVPVPYHHAQSLTAELVSRAERIFCMTESQRLAVLQTFPDSASKVFCLHPVMGIEDPNGESKNAFSSLAKRLQEIIDPLVDGILGALETPQPS